MSSHTKKNSVSGKATFSFNDDDDTGLHSSAANTVDIVAGGTTIASATSAGLAVSSGGLTVSAGDITLSTSGKRIPKVAITDVTGAAGSSGVFASWANPESGTILITRALLYISTQSTGASTIDIGTTPTSATTVSDTLIDGVSGATAGVFDNLNDAGTNGKSRQTLATGKWVTLAEASGDVNGLVGKLVVEYIVP